MNSQFSRMFSTTILPPTKLAFVYLKWQNESNCSHASPQSCSIMWLLNAVIDVLVNWGRVLLWVGPMVAVLIVLLCRSARALKTSPHISTAIIHLMHTVCACLYTDMLGNAGCVEVGLWLTTDLLQGTNYSSGNDKHLV